MHMFRYFTRRYLILSIVIITILLIIYTKNYILHETIECYRIKENVLPDILDANPRKGKSIFFHETSCSSHYNGKIEISTREACAVESAAIMNPNFDIYLLFTSPGLIHYEGTLSDRLLKVLLTYKNLNIRHLDYEEYTKNTPLEDLYKSGKIEASYYPRSHASDVLRYLTLWKYGGIYLDLDVVVVKSLEELQPNFAGAESERNVAAGVLALAATGKGHHLAELCVDELKHNFKGNDWGYNGPGVITRILKKICAVQTAKEMWGKNCQDFTIFPPEAFYAVQFEDWAMYFDRNLNDKVLEMTKNSYVVHVWNKFSKDTKIKVNSSDVPYGTFAKKYCPKVFAECDEYF